MSTSTQTRTVACPACRAANPYDGDNCAQCGEPLAAAKLQHALDEIQRVTADFKERAAPRKTFHTFNGFGTTLLDYRALPDGTYEATRWVVAMMLPLVPLATYVISFILIRTISRYREYAADRGSALITGAPEQLMSALQKIASDIIRIPQRDLREVETMNAFFIIPTSIKSSVGELFATHPPLEKRLARLAAIAREMGRPVE